ncbi:MAG: Holliday junction branch migration protein RuvA [Thermogutta sp.]
MITRISGILVQITEEAATLETGPFWWEVFVPEYTRRQLQSRVHQEVVLHTVLYLEGAVNTGRQIPRLIGFLTEIEREFFDLLCSVDGMGAKKALRAMSHPVNEIANAIEQQDHRFLASLPGVGPATAERIVAKLRRKMPKFALWITQQKVSEEALVEPDVVTQTFQTLVALGHSEAEARRLIDAVLARKKKFASVDEMLHAIYERQTQQGVGPT